MRSSVQSTCKFRRRGGTRCQHAVQQSCVESLKRRPRVPAKLGQAREWPNAERRETLYSCRASRVKGKGRAFVGWFVRCPARVLSPRGLRHVVVSLGGSQGEALQQRSLGCLATFDAKIAGGSSRHGHLTITTHQQYAQGPTSIARRRRNIGSPSPTGLCPSRSRGKEEMQSAACPSSPPALSATESAEPLVPAALPPPLLPPPTVAAAFSRESFTMKYSSKRADFSSSSFAASCVKRTRSCYCY